MRTTLSIDDDSLKLLRAFAKTRGISLGHAASELIRVGSRYQVTTNRVNGLPVFEVPSDFPLVTDDLVSELQDA